jgi:hypothetical protein
MFGAHDAAFLEQRREQLEKYLKAISVHRKVADSSNFREGSQSKKIMKLLQPSFFYACHNLWR